MRYRYWLFFLFLFLIHFPATAENLGFSQPERHTLTSAKTLENSNNVLCSLVSIIGNGIIQPSLQINPYTRFNPSTNKTSEKHFFSGSFSNSILLRRCSSFFVKDNRAFFLNLRLPLYLAYRKLII